MKKEYTIQDLKKHDQFIFNDNTYTVHKKYRNDDSPLITECGELFHNEEMPINFIGKNPKRIYHEE